LKAATGTAVLNALLLPAFLLSGLAALLYQVVWQRLLTFSVGTDAPSVALIVTIFMAGLGLGSLVGGQLADRLAPRGRLLAFAAAELAVGAFALASVELLYRRVFLGLEGRAPGSVTAAVLFMLLLAPTSLMGLSLPLLARVITESASRAAQRVGWLMGWNTVGAALGALVTVFWLVRTSGFEGAVRAGALLNFGCAGLAVLALAPLRAVLRARPDTGGDGAAGIPPVASAFSFRTWLLLYVLSGFVALSLEILWFRVVGTVLKSSAFTFATLLAFYLAGLGLGALLASGVVRRSRRPALAYLALQACVAPYAALSLAAFVYALGRWSALDPVLLHLGQDAPLEIAAALSATAAWLGFGGELTAPIRDLATTFVLVHVAVPAALVLPGTILMGLSFPFLQRQVQTDLVVLGRRVGGLQAANILGSMAGAAGTGLWLLPGLGTAGSLEALLALAAVFPLMMALERPASVRGRGGAAAAAAALALGVAASPDPPTLWARLHATTPEHVTYAEDGSALALYKDLAKPGGHPTDVFVNGVRQSQLPFGGEHVLLGALPALLHPQPERALVIGLGSATTLFGIGGREVTRAIDCVEIVAAQLPPLRLLAQRPDYGSLSRLLADGRVRLTFTDGRSFLMRSVERWDVIEADALDPTAAYSGSLYSVEYFELMRRRLRPGGIGVTWCPTPRVRAAFLRAFPHALEIRPILLGSDRAIPHDAQRLGERAREDFTRRYYTAAGVDIEALLSGALAEAPTIYAPERDPSWLGDANTDLFPRDEFMAGAPLLGP
jgi:predicted membrane-bound spermidine synthase